MDSRFSQNLTDLARFDDAARPSIPVQQIYDPNDDDTQELPTVDLRAWEIEQIKRDMHNIAAKQARQDMQMAALKRRLDDLEGDGR